MTFLRRFLAFVALGGHFLASVGGPWLHDHGHTLGPCADSQCQAKPPAGHTCCAGHHHCDADSPERNESPEEEPCRHLPGHHDHCLICQMQADVPHPVALVAVQVAGEPVAEFPKPPPPCPPERHVRTVFDSRGPPTV